MSLPMDEDTFIKPLTLVCDIIRTLATVALAVGMWKRWFVDERKLQVEQKQVEQKQAQEER